MFANRNYGFKVRTWEAGADMNASDALVTLNGVPGSPYTRKMLALLRYPQRMIGRERLIEMTRSRIGGPTDRSIDVLISRLRRKLGDGRKSRPIIRTIRGVGYMLAVDVRAA